MTIFKTLTYRYKLLFLKSGKPYIKREFTHYGFTKWMEKQ